MRTQGVAELTQAAQIDDACDPRRGGSAGERFRELAIAARVGFAAGFHRMHEVIGRRASVHMLRERLRMPEIALDDLDPWIAAPAAFVQFSRLADEASDRIAGGKLVRDPATTDIPGRA